MKQSTSKAITAIALAAATLFTPLKSQAADAVMKTDAPTGERILVTSNKTNVAGLPASAQNNEHTTLYQVSDQWGGTLSNIITVCNGTKLVVVEEVNVAPPSVKGGSVVFAKLIDKAQAIVIPTEPHSGLVIIEIKEMPQGFCSDKGPYIRDEKKIIGMARKLKEAVRTASPTGTGSFVPLP